MPSYKRGRGKDGKGQDYQETRKKKVNAANSEFSFSRTSITDVAASRSAASVVYQRGFVESAEEAIRKRLIPDLMRVYETITQNSVPTETLNNDETRRNGNSHPQTILENNSHPNDRFDRFNSYSANQQYDDSNQLALEGIYGYHRESFQQNLGTMNVLHHQPSQNQTYPVSQMQQQRLDVSSRNSTATNYYEHSAQAFHNGLVGNRPWTQQQDTPKIQNLERSTEFDSDASSGGGSSKKQGSTSDFTKKTDISEGNEDNHSRSKVGRWTKRFIWPDCLHRDFVSAIFSLGLERCSPSAVLLQIPEAALSLERVQIILTRYKHHQRFINKIWKNQDISESNMNRQQTTSNSEQVGRVESNAASLEESKRSTPRKVSVTDSRNLATKIKLNGSYQAESFLVLPRLTDAEKDSSMGKCLGHLMALFFHLKQELTAQRNENNPGQTQEMNQRTDIASPPPDAAAATRQYYENELEETSVLAQPPGFDFNSIFIRGSLNLHLGSHSASASVRSELEMLADVSANPSTTLSMRSENSTSSISTTLFRQSRIKIGSDQQHNTDANRPTAHLFNYNQMPDYSEGQANRISHESSTNNFDANADQDGIDLSVHDVEALRASAQQASDDQSATYNDDGQRRPRPRSYSDVT